MLILSPNTTFEYATLVLGAISFALVELTSGRPFAAPAGLSLAVAMLLLGVLLPRQVLNRLTFAGTISLWSGYAHLTASEAYQYYCFPLAGLFLLGAAIWNLQPPASAPTPAPDPRPAARAARA
jgi:hypothetical protein